MNYSERKAEEYWNRRAGNIDQARAVLSLGLPDYINKAYSKWEMGLILRELPEIRSKNVLDIACGIGRVTIPLAEHGAHVVGVDISKTMLELCHKNLESVDVRKNITLLKIRCASELPFKNDLFDVVLCLGLLEHLPPNIRERVLLEISRVTKRGGIALIIVNNDKSLFLQKMDRYKMEYQQKNGYFVSLMEKEGIESILEENGFDVKEVGSNLFYSFIRHVTEPLQESNHDILPWDPLFNLCAELDLKFKNKGDLDEHFTDQYLIKGIKRRR